MSSQRIEAKVGVSGLVFNRNGDILMIQRSTPPQAGFWHIPGGKLEPGEDLKACCEREIFEETGLKATAGPIIAIADRKIEGFHYLIVDFLAFLQEPDDILPMAQSDALSARWVNPQDLSELPLVQGICEVIKAGQSINQRLSNQGLHQNLQINWLYLADQSMHEE